MEARARAARGAAARVRVRVGVEGVHLIDRPTARRGARPATRALGRSGHEDMFGDHLGTEPSRNDNDETFVCSGPGGLLPGPPLPPDDHGTFTSMTRYYTRLLIDRRRIEMLTMTHTGTRTGGSRQAGRQKMLLKEQICWVTFIITHH